MECYNLRRIIFFACFLLISIKTAASKKYLYHPIQTTSQSNVTYNYATKNKNYLISNQRFYYNVKRKDVPTSQNYIPRPLLGIPSYQKLKQEIRDKKNFQPSRTFQPL